MNDSSNTPRTALQVELELELEDLRVKVQQLVDTNASLVDDNDNLRKACDNLRSNHNRTQGLLDLRDDEIRALRSQIARAAASGAPLPPVSPVTATFSMLSAASASSASIPALSSNTNNPLPPLPAALSLSHIASASHAPAHAHAHANANAHAHAHANANAHAHAHPNPLQLRASGSRLARMLRLQQELVGSVRSELMHLAETEQQSSSAAARQTPTQPCDGAEAAASAESPVLATITRTHQLTDALERLAESVQVEVDATVAAQQASLDDRLRDLESDLVRARQQGELHQQEATKLRTQLDQLTVTAHHHARALQTANTELHRMTAERDAARSALDKASRQLHRANEDVRLARDETFRLRRKVALDSAELDRLRHDLARAQAHFPPPPSSVASDTDSVLLQPNWTPDSRRSSVASHCMQHDTIPPIHVSPTQPQPQQQPTAPGTPTLLSVPVPVPLPRLDMPRLEQELAHTLTPIVARVEATEHALHTLANTPTASASEWESLVATLSLCNTQLLGAQLAHQLRISVHSLEVAEATLAHRHAECASLHEALRTVTVEKDYLVSEVDLLKRLTEERDPNAGKDHVAWGEFLLSELRRLAQSNAPDGAGNVSPTVDRSFGGSEAALTASQVTALEAEIRTLTQYISSILHRVFDQGDQDMIEAVLSRRDSASIATTPPTTPIATPPSRSRPTSSGSAWGSAWRDIASGLLHEASRIRRGSRGGVGGGTDTTVAGAASSVSALPAVSEAAHLDVVDHAQAKTLSPPPRSSRRQPSLATMSVRLDSASASPSTNGTRRPGFFRLFSPLASTTDTGSQHTKVDAGSIQQLPQKACNPTVAAASQSTPPQAQGQRSSWSLFGSTPPVTPR